MTEALASAVDAAMARILDPCSVGVGAPVNILDLGILRSCAVDDDGVVRVVLRPTTPACMMIGSIVAAIETELSTIPDVRDLDVQVDTTDVWTPELMSDAARADLEARRQRFLRDRTVVPRQWEQQGAARRD